LRTLQSGGSRNAIFAYGFSKTSITPETSWSYDLRIANCSEK